jgi:hypothetical protein
MGSTVIARGHAVQGGAGGGSIKRYFDITPTTNTGLNATLVFKYDDTELSGATESDLVLFKSTDSGASWASAGGSVNATANTITLSGVNDLSRWTAATTAYSVGVPIATNWNMVSLPVSNPIPDDSVKHIFVNLHPSVQFAYAFVNNYVVRHVLTNGPGYWIKSAQSYTQNITGTRRDTATVGVGAGWNMIGSISSTIDTSVGHVTPSVSGLRTLGVPFYKFTNTYVAATTIDPGLGYWVKATQAGSFFMHATTPAGKVEGERSLRRGRSADELNTLTISDGNGVSQTLYFGADATGEIPSYELPPLPPAGSFDVRFASPEGGMLVKTHPMDMHKATDAPILIQSSAYPLTIAWKVSASDVVYELVYGEGLRQTLSGGGTVKINNPEVTRLTLRINENPDGTPTEFALDQNYPNPFNPTTNISYALPVASKVVVEIFNVIGQNVRTIANDEQAAGRHVVEWDGEDDSGNRLASGVYFLRLSANGKDSRSFRQVMKLLMLK